MDVYNDPPEPHKRCARCKEDKPVTAFYRSDTTRDGLRATCKVCHVAYRQSPEAKAKLKAYLSTPEARLRQKGYSAKYRAKKKGTKPWAC